MNKKKRQTTCIIWDIENYKPFVVMYSKMFSNAWVPYFKFEYENQFYINVFSKFVYTCTKTKQTEFFF